MSLYLGIALFLIISICISAYTQNKALERYLFAMAFVSLFLIAGFRSSDVGSDSFHYQALYESFSYGGIYQPNLTRFFTGRMEYGYLLLNQFLYQFSHHYSFLFAICSFLTLSLFFVTIKKQSKDIFMSLIIFFGYRLYTFSMSSIRASLSIALCFYAYHLFVQKKKIACLLMIAVAGSFHLSALLFLVIFFLDYLPLNKKTMTLSLSFAVIVFVNIRLFLPYILSFLRKYNFYENILEVNLATIINFLIVALCVVLGEYFLQKRKKKMTILRKLIFLNLLIALLGMQIPMVGRVNYLFGSLMMLYIPEVLQEITAHDLRFLWKSFVIFGFLAHFFVILILRPEWNVLIPYHSLIWSFFY